jgi:hypothetical protein
MEDEDLRREVLDTIEALRLQALSVAREARALRRRISALPVEPKPTKLPKPPKTDTPGGRLRAAIAASGYKSIRDFSEQTGIWSTNVYTACTGNRRMTLKNAESYAKYLLCDAEWILTGNGRPPK